MCDMTQGGTQKAEGQNVPRQDKQRTKTTYLLLDMLLNLLPWLHVALKLHVLPQRLVFCSAQLPKGNALTSPTGQMIAFPCPRNSCQAPPEFTAVAIVQVSQPPLLRYSTS